MAGTLGMNPDTVRSQANSLGSQMASIESIAATLDRSRQASQRPQSFGLESTDKVISPEHLGTAQSAHNDLLAAVAAARNLIQAMLENASDQENTSAESSNAPRSGTIAPVAPGDTGAGGGESSDTTVRSAGFSKFVPDAEAKMSTGGPGTPDSFDGLATPKSAEPSMEFSVDAEVRDGVTVTRTHTDSDGNVTSEDTEESFTGSALKHGQTVKITDDSVTYSNETGVTVGTTNTSTSSYENEETGYSSESSTTTSGTIGTSSGTSTTHDEDGITHEASSKAEVIATASASGSFANEGGLGGEGSATATASVSAEATASVKQGDDGSVVVAATLAAGATVAVSAEGSLEYGVASVNGSVEAAATVSSTATATGTIGPDGASVSAGVSAMAVASASASGDIEAMGVSGGVTGEVYAGAGIEANVGGSVTMEEISVTVDLGIALGVGAGVSVDLSFSPKECLDDLTSLFW